jgi:phage gpG-like protein
MPVGFTVTLQGDKELLDGLKNFAEGIIDLQEEFESTGKYLLDFETQQVFESEGQVFGEPWQPLSEEYSNWKHKHFPNRPILEATGNMRRGFYFTMLNSRQALFHNVYDEQYLKYHQTGAPKHNLPKRVLYKLDDDRKQAIMKIFTDGVKRRLAQTFHGQ